MKYEVTCNSRACPSRIVIGRIGDDEETFHHVMMSSNRDRCPCCGARGVRVMRSVVDEHRFALGVVVITPAAEVALGNDDEAMKRLVDRHVVGDWGDVTDPEVNEASIGDDRKPGERARLLSIYEYAGQSIWIMTEAGHHATTIMLPEDY